MKKVIFLLIYLSAVMNAISALSVHDIFHADSESLRNMAALRGIDTSLSDDRIRNELYKAEGLEAVSEREDEEGTYSVLIEGADYLSSSQGVITLRGNASLSFSKGDDETVMSSDEVVIDTSSSLIVALGNVNFSSQGENNAQRIDADIVSFYWEKGNLVVENASTLNERKNSEGEDVNVYSVGERLTYFDNGSAIYEDGYIASSDDDPLSSISASRITMLPGSDMLIENAVLNIGRVPIFYFPFFFFPGSRITGNPSFGFTSTRGAFLNTTFEIFGHSQLIDNSDSSSFASIFSDVEESDDLVPRGAYYTADQDLSALESWADTSESHMAVMADAYQETGLHLGLDTKINLFDKSLGFDSFSGVALTYTNNANESNFRYYSENSLSYSFSGLSLLLSYPIYSDSNVLVDFGNRITSFSIESLFFQSPSFPSTYSSAITSFSRIAELKYSLPSSLRSDYLSSLSISRLRAESRYSWDSRNHKYVIDYIDLPNLTASASGSFFNFEYEDEGEDEEELDEAELFLLSDPLLYDVFHEDLIREGHAGAAYSIGMGYSINQDLENNLEYSDGEQSSSSLSSTSSLRLTTELDLGDYFLLRSIITPSYTYEKEEDDEELSWSDEFLLTNTIEAEIPYIGLKYSLTNRAYEHERMFSDEMLETKDSLWRFDKDHVSTHSISLSKTFSTAAGDFTPSISYTLYPLTGSLTPSLSYRYGDFATSFSYRFQNDEENDGAFLSDLIKLSLAYNGTNIIASSSFSYQSADYDKNAFFRPLEISSQFSLRTSDKAYSITEQLEWKGYDSASGLENYVSSLKTILSVPYFTCYVDFTGPFSSLSLDTVNASIKADDILIRGWKNRIYLSLGLSSTLNLDIQNIAASSFTITPSIIFSIAEFLDFRLSFTSSNNNFASYQDERGKFSLSELFNDLVRSFDFFGEGRYNTNFNMSQINLEVVHYMQDWALHCNYSSSVVLSDDVYRFVPQFSIYLSWNTFPDLKIDESWEMDGDDWIRSN